jgi:hypothetical protein
VETLPQAYNLLHLEHIIHCPVLHSCIPLLWYRHLAETAIIVSISVLARVENPSATFISILDCPSQTTATCSQPCASMYSFSASSHLHAGVSHPSSKQLTNATVGCRDSPRRAGHSVSKGRDSSMHLLGQPKSMLTARNPSAAATSASHLDKG